VPDNGNLVLWGWT